MNTQSTILRAVLFGGALLAAVGAGFLIARSTAQAPPPAAPVAAAPVAAEPQELKLEPSYLDAVGIKTEAVSAGNLSADVLAPATVTAAPNGEAVVTAHVAGAVVQLSRQLGDAVRAGETLALVESREAAAMAAEQSVANSKADLARSQLAREQELFNQRVTPRQDLERAQAELAVAEAEVRRAREAAAASHVTQDGRIAVVSPLAGRITAMRAALGAFVQPDSELFRIADPRFVQVEASVTAMDADRIAIGDTAKITTAAGARLDATVRSVSPTLNEQTRAATIILSLMGDHGSLSPGEAVQAVIMPKNAMQTGVTVAEDAVQNVGGRTVVFVRTTTGFQVRPVVTGARGAGRVSVLSGLNAGETIATANAFFLKAELAKSEGEGE